MTPQEVLDFAKTEIVAASAKRSVVIPAAVIALGFLGLAIGARYQRDAVGMLLGVALGFGIGESIATPDSGTPRQPAPHDPQEAEPLKPAGGINLANMPAPPPTRQAPGKQGPPAAS